MIKEYLITEAEEFKVLRDRYNSKVLDEEIRNIIINTRKELDKRFIDREELKEKINDIDIWHKNGLQLKKEILELIDK